MTNPDLSRIAVVGTTCSGKTSLAAALARRLSLRHIELDALHWLPHWRERDKAGFRALVDQATAAPRWVSCGNNSRVQDLVWGRATAIIWLNYSFPRVLWRGLGRTVRRSLTRELLYSGNRESFGKSFFSRDSILRWLVTSYPERRRAYREIFDGGAFDHLTMLELRRPDETRRFLDSL